MSTQALPAPIDAETAPNRPPGHVPKAPAWTALLDAEDAAVVYAQLGVQHPGANETAAGKALLAELVGVLSGETGPAALDRATHVDTAGCRNDVLMAYWPSPDRYAGWTAREDVGEAVGRLPSGELGLWREVLTIPAARFETLHSTERGRQGVSHFASLHPTQVHEYDGGARDRIGASHGDALQPTVGPLVRRRVESRGRTITVHGPDNVCFIRTAQDWSRCQDSERQIYLQDVAPALERGTGFLMTHPEETGCISGRFVRELEPDGEPAERTCFLGFFASLGDLERWTWSHETHAAIFGSFMEMVARQNFEIDLALWHEVSVLSGDSLALEYRNCHPDTGLLPFFG